MKIKFSAVFLALLVLNIGFIFTKTEFECSCFLLSPEEFSPCCNCPHCVSKRGGFLSACSCHESTEKPFGDIPLIKRVTCFCGYHGDFDLPGLKFPALLSKNLFLPPALEIHPYFQVPSTLSSQVYLTPPDHPS